MRLCRTLYFATALICAGSLCLAQGTKLVECPNDRVYRDNRGDAGGGNAGGGQVYCEHVLPGSLMVKEGPFRFWFNRDFEGAAGNYHEGREVGKWKECDRFGRCKATEHPLLYPIEEQRVETRAEVPVSFEKGKYTFDFKSCWSTRITHLSDGKPDFDLGFATWPDGCDVEYLPLDPAAWEKEHFGCKIRFKSAYDHLTRWIC